MIVYTDETNRVIYAGNAESEIRYTKKYLVSGLLPKRRAGKIICCNELGFYYEDDPDYSTPKPVLTPVQFKMLWTSQERIAAKALKQTDEIVEDFYSILEDPNLESVDFNLKSVRDGVAYLVSKLSEQGVVVDADQRISEILTGTPV